MKYICSWCGIDIKSEHVDGISDEIISHGICKECQDDIFSEMGIPLQNYLDMLPKPIAVVSENGMINLANEEAQKVLHKNSEVIKGKLRGDVFECAYAKFPEGCGNTIHCSGCVIRITVDDTFNTGKSHLQVPATLNRGVIDDYQQVRFLISTQKVNNVVLLRIDDIDEIEDEESND